MSILSIFVNFWRRSVGMTKGDFRLADVSWLVLTLGFSAHVQAEMQTVSAACPQDVDVTSGSRLLWNATQANQTTFQPCPDGAKAIGGNQGISRTCVLMPSSPTGAVWQNPDVSSCMNVEMKYWARTVIDAEHANTQLMVDQVDKLHILIEEAAEADRLYPSDIVVGAHVMHVVAQDIHLVEDALNETLALVQAYADLVGAFTSSHTKDAWSNFNDEDTVSQLAGSLLTSTELLARNLFDLRQTVDIEQTSSEESDDSALWNHISVKSDTMDFEIVIMESVLNASAVVDLRGDNDSTSVMLAGGMLEQLRTNDSLLGVYRAQFTTVADLLSGSSMDHFSETNMSEHLVSDLLSVTVLGVEEEELANLTQPVLLTFKHEGKLEGNQGKCHFLNMASQSADDRWSDRGCHVTTNNETHTTCACTHLTNFALLMDLFQIGSDIGEHHLAALTYLSYIGGTLSVLGCALSVATYEILRLSSEHIRIHEMLALAITLAQTTFFIGFDRTENKHVCKALAMVLHYFLLCLFCWMLIEGIHLYVSLIKVFRRDRHLPKYLAAGWGLPLINVCITVAVFLDEYISEDFCWLSTKVLLVGFVPFVALTVLANTGVLIAVVRTMLHSQRRGSKTGQEDVSAIRTGVKATLVLLPLLGLSWVFGFMSVDPASTLVFTYLFTIFNSLQGVLFFIFHCALNRDVRAGVLYHYRRARSNHSLSDTNATCAGSHDYASRDKGEQDVVGQLPAVSGGKMQACGRGCKKRGSDYSTASNDTTATTCGNDGPKSCDKSADAADDPDFPLDPLALDLSCDTDPPPPYDAI